MRAFPDCCKSLAKSVPEPARRPKLCEPLFCEDSHSDSSMSKAASRSLSLGKLNCRKVVNKLAMLQKKKSSRESGDLHFGAKQSVAFDGSVFALPDCFQRGKRKNSLQSSSGR